MPANFWPHVLISWFKTHQREMPWRSDPQPYYVWLSEVMLQQTQVVTVIPYFHRFLAQFPTVEALANSELEPVLKLWEGLGYYSRARNLHKAAQQVMRLHGGVIPSDYVTLQTLSGLGPYSAAAVASIAFGDSVPVVDGNVIRVFCRFWGISDDSRSPRVRTLLFDRLKSYISAVNASYFNQAMMELGALVCTPKSPRCLDCPLSSDCVAYQDNRTETLPYTPKKPKVPHYAVSVGFCLHDASFLILKRKEKGMLGGLWELPGGKVLEGESFSEAMVREFREKTGLSVVSDYLCGAIRHAYTHYKITVYVFECHLDSDVLPPSTDTLKWIPKQDISLYPFSKGTLKAFHLLFKS